jgi:aspartate/methionine/tyrosine aminotransferase
MASTCARRGAAIISDEVFVDYPLDRDAWRARAVLEHQADVLGFTLGGLSKSVGLPQLKLAWTAVSGPPALVDEAMARLEFICDSYLSVATPVQLGLRRILETAAHVREQILQRVCRNHSLCQARVREVPSCSLLHTEGGWTATIRVPRLMSEEALVMSLLEDSRVLVHPGYFFDFEDEAYVVVSLLAPERDFREGIERVLQRFRDSA